MYHPLSVIVFDEADNVLSWTWCCISPDRQSTLWKASSIGSPTFTVSRSELLGRWSSCHDIVSAKYQLRWNINCHRQVLQHESKNKKVISILMGPGFWKLYCKSNPEIAEHLRRFYCFDGWSERLVVSFVRRPTNAQGNSGFFKIINTFQIPSLTCFGIWLPSSGSRECLDKLPTWIMICPMWPVVLDIPQQLTTWDRT
jgi:hypothetical protein